MKPLRQSTLILALCLAVAIVSGCQNKKPVVVVPQQPPSTVAPTPAPTPTPEPTPAEPAEQPQPAQPAATEQAQADKAQKEKPRHARKPSPRKPAPAGTEKTEMASRSKSPTVVPAEPASTPAEGQISPGPMSTDSAQEKASTEQLLHSAENNLNAIKRQLSKDEEAIREQIKEFISQSRKATTENDLARAHLLAVKARLLSDDLVKQR